MRVCARSLAAAIVVIVCVAVAYYWPPFEGLPLIGDLLSVGDSAQVGNSPQHTGPRRTAWMENCATIDFEPPLISMASKPLTTEALKDSEAAATYASSPTSRQFFKYMVQCALPEGKKLTLETPDGPEEFEGSLGAAPEWADGPCGTDCQEWVSACILARINAYGLPVKLFFAAAGTPLGGADDAAASGAPNREGAFYGNIFGNPMRGYTCRADGHDPLYESVRVCSRPGNLCGMQFVGTCLDEAEPVCEADALGDFTKCRSPGSADGKQPARVWTHVVTTYWRDSMFRPGMEATCDVEPPPAPDYGPPNGAGHLCGNDSDCEGECVVCDGWSGKSQCTTACIDSEPADEQEQCGDPESTCVSFTPPYGACTKACVPMEAGNCDPGLACTSAWFAREVRDNAGCVAFCTSDADCSFGSQCNPRVGACGMAPAVEGLLADGEPCDPTDLDALPESLCRGLCAGIVPTDPTHGLCASFIDRTTATECPDDPEHMKPFGPTDDELAICLYKGCSANSDCTAPLVCVGPPLGARVCTWQ